EPTSKKPHCCCPLIVRFDAPGPARVRSSLTMSLQHSSAIVPVTLKFTVSEPLPAPHSPDIAPEAASVLAAVIASRRVQEPSSATTSAVLFTVIVAARAGEPLV